MSAMVRTMDVSVVQPRDLHALVTAHRPSHVVVRLYLPEESVAQEHTRAQIVSARAAGCTVGGYVWCYRDLDPRKSVRDAVTLARSCGLRLPILWLHAEAYVVADAVRDPGPDAGWLLAAVAEARALGVRVGIMTAAAWWRMALPGTEDLAELPLWLGCPREDADDSQAAHDDSQAAHDDSQAAHGEAALPFGGWHKAAGVHWRTADAEDVALVPGRLRADLTALQADP
ncbi:MAG: hypothetical protein IT306_22200 [Chloroflexi bacterium]|nr:hypothetical protein [Chloroflexota bacterium]